MTGLVTARVLSDHFEEVTLIERDVLSDELTTARKGVPQGRHLHILLARGEQILSQLFPGFVPGLVQEGAELLDFGRDLAWFFYGSWMVRTDDSLPMICVSRPLLEAHVRRRVFATRGVRKLDGHEVSGLRTTPDRQRVTGVTVQRPGDPSSAEALEADLVVEASGRGSRLPTWLEGLGYPRPEETSIEIDLGYATRLYRQPSPSPYPWKALYVQDATPSRRQGVITPVEGGRWIVTLAGILGEHPPRDPQGFLDFAKSLQHDELYRAVSSAEPLSDIETYRFPAHLRRHYERMPRFPEGLVVAGDASTSFSPTFGQGMSAACLTAMALDQALVDQRQRRGPGNLTGLPRHYHSAAAKATLQPWLLASGEDFRFPEVKGQRPLSFTMMRWFVKHLLRAARTDAVVYKRFMRITHLLSPVEELLDPRVLVRVIRAPDVSSTGEPFASALKKTG